jgi:hypothetical protein
MGYYVMQNADIIWRMHDEEGVPLPARGNILYFKIDRKARTLTDESSNTVYPIPDDWNLN